MGCFFVFFFFYSVLCSFSNVTNSINALSIHFIDQVESLLYSEAHLHIQEEFIKNHCTEGAIEPLLCSSTWPLCFARCSSLRGPHCLLHSCLLPQEHPSFVLPTTSSLHLLSFSLYKIHQECRGFFFFAASDFSAGTSCAYPHLVPACSLAGFSPCQQNTSVWTSMIASMQVGCKTAACLRVCDGAREIPLCELSPVCAKNSAETEQRRLYSQILMTEMKNNFEKPKSVHGGLCCCYLLHGRRKKFLCSCDKQLMWKPVFF